jgi:hypothetical protein
MKRLIFVFAAFLLLSTGHADDERPDRQPKIQVAILLDVSGSMEGLINQARSQIWSIVNVLGRSHRDGQRPTLEVALYAYGRNSRPGEENRMRQLCPFTTDLDRISEHLFALQIEGSEEYCGTVIDSAVHGLSWSPDSRDLKEIIIAGNEPFTQGPVDYHRSCRSAFAKGVIVNTIHCGPEIAGIEGGWRDGAVIGGGAYLVIDHNAAVATVTTPYDEPIAKLGVEINVTYIPFGHQGHAGFTRQAAQDSNAGQLSAGSFCDRAASKASANYTNAAWDLCDAIKADAAKLEDMRAEDLPDNMRAMSAAERRAYVDGQVATRARIQQEISNLNVKRAAYIAEQNRANATETLDTALIKAICEQGTKRNFMFEK